MTTTVFHAPAAIITGAGCRAQLPEYLAQLNSRVVLLVTDAFLINSGVIAPFIEALGASGVRVVVFDRVQPDPTDLNVADGVAAYQLAQADTVVAIGGGSPIDCAKVISASLANPGPIARFQGYHQIPLAGPPVVAIPTTAGTGSEATKAAVITQQFHQSCPRREEL